MKRIASFEVDHTDLQKGMYTSRVDGDVVTYDIRTRRPNVEEVMDNASIHTVEHLFATFVRNSPLADKIIYFGPMGCRTGFYFLVRDMVQEDAIRLTQDAFAFIAAYEGEIPGVSAAECGNYRDHSLEGAIKEAKLFLPVIEKVTVESLVY
jgi:S-ribosylhomocysteine lyase